MTETPSDDPQTGAWLTLADAERFLKVTVRTIDRRGYMKRRGAYGRVEVWIPGATSDDVSDDDEPASDTVSDPISQALALSDIVSDAVRQHTAPLLEALERSEARGRILEREQGRSEEQRAALLRVLEVVRQASDADRRDSDNFRRDSEAYRLRMEKAESEAAQAAEATRIERQARLDAEAEVQRLKQRRWWQWW